MNAPPLNVMPQDPLAGAGPALSLQLFGHFAGRLGGEPLPKLRTRKEQWLLALLALHSQSAVERPWLAATLWPDATDEAAQYNLRRSLHVLRDILGPEHVRIQSPTPRTLRMDLGGAECDVLAFDAAIRAGDEASLLTASALYRGPLLAGCLEEWASGPRQAREQAALGALETLAYGARGRGAWADAADHLRRALELDPLRETCLRALMEALAAQGSHAAAADAYRTFRRRLRDEMNAEPDPQTAALYQTLRAQARGAAVPPKPCPTSENAASPASALPWPVSSLVGRERETEDVCALLERARLVTLAGTGGVGKTRLALAVAHALHDEFADGVWFVDLAPLADPQLMAPAVLQVLCVREGPGQSPSQALADHLRSRHLLLVLDNCEHLVAASAQLAQTLLRECVQLRVLATSREVLGVTGEAAWRVPSLSLPDGDTPGEAVALFLERAGRELGEDQELIGHICRRLDGIPLAIEMAAARRRAMTLSQIARRLDDVFGLLARPHGDLLPRQQTLRATLDWSYDLLGEQERMLLARLSVFAGWTLEAAEAVCAGGGLAADELPDRLTSLVDKSLVVFDNSGRYRLLETVRQYGRERLRESGTAHEVGLSHRDYFLRLAEQAQAGMAGARQAEWLDLLESEHDNLWAALSWSQQGGAEEALRFVCALSRFWLIRGYLSEGRAFLSAALNADGPEPSYTALREALGNEAGLALSQGRYAEADGLFEQMLTVCRHARDHGGEAVALGGQGAVKINQGEYAAAQALLEQALALNRQFGNREDQAANLGSLGYLAREAGDYSAAEAFLSEAVEISREHGNTLAEASALGSLAYVFLQRGDRDGGRRLLERSLALCRQIGDRLGEAWTLNSLGDVAADDGDVAGAIRLVEQALSINRAVGNRARQAWNLSTLGGLQIRQDRCATAQVTLLEALRLDREAGSRTTQAWTLFRLGDAARGLGDFAAARISYTESLALMRALGVLQGIVTVQEALAALTSAEGAA